MHKSYDELEFLPDIPPLTPDLSALERLKNLCIMLLQLLGFHFDF